MRPVSPEEVDALLPQTQCGLCGYNGCMPYAEAICHENAAIDLCPPGGVKTLIALAELLKEDPTPFVPEMKKKENPKSRAVIREAECIGCTKCIQACPVDAILGSAKNMHTVIATECTGCELCIAPCPVDCIDLVLLPEENSDSTEKADVARERYYARQKRLAQEKLKKNSIEKNNTLAKRKNYIQAAILRVKAKKLTTGDQYRILEK